MDCAPCGAGTSSPSPRSWSAAWPRRDAASSRPHPSPSPSPRRPRRRRQAHGDPDPDADAHRDGDPHAHPDADGHGPGHPAAARHELPALPRRQRVARRHLEAAGQLPQQRVAHLHRRTRDGCCTRTSARPATPRIRGTESPTPSCPERTPSCSLDFDYPDESDRVGYPVGGDTKIEWGSDRHALIVDKDACKLYEVYDLDYPASNGAGSGATWDLRSNALRPRGWTSADAAGLPILPGLLRVDEVQAGKVDHAVRVTFSRTDSAASCGRRATRRARPT